LKKERVRVEEWETRESDDDWYVVGSESVVE